MTPYELADKVQAIKDLFDTMELNESEFKEMMSDVVHQRNILEASLELEENIKYKNYIDSVISIAAAI
jgi:polyhydroxyalkanoate synthesis regulator phasin